MLSSPLGENIVNPDPGMLATYLPTYLPAYLFLYVKAIPNKYENFIVAGGKVLH